MLAVEESALFHPRMVDELLRRMDDDVAGALLVTRIPEKADLAAYLRKHRHYLRPAEMMRLALRVSSAKLGPLGGRPASVRSVLKRRGVPTFEVRNSINDPDCLAFVRAARPDVIVNSQSQILGREILALPTRGWLNRHHSLLPSYAGLMPVFHALRHGETSTGVSIHVMQEAVDAGPVIAQRRVAIEPHDTVMTLYDRLFDESVPAVLDALAKMRAGAATPVSGSAQPSYYSFPKPEDWRAFRAGGRQFA